MCIRDRDEYVKLAATQNLPVQNEVKRLEARRRIKQSAEVHKHLTFKVGAVSYTHLDVYKRQGSRHFSTYSDISSHILNTFNFFIQFVSIQSYVIYRDIHEQFIL